jgi:hypothetical protein
VFVTDGDPRGSWHPSAGPGTRGHRLRNPEGHARGTIQPSSGGKVKVDELPRRTERRISYAIFPEIGTYVEAWYGRLVRVGVWRDTGVRTDDLVIVTHELGSLDERFGQSHVAVPADLNEAAPLTLWRTSLEFDETGNAFTATGTAETQDASGTVLDSFGYSGRGDRTILAVEPV